MLNDTPDRPPKPCIALMGEFSAGKSTLANLLIGSDPLPVQVIATQLPPVCISYGDGEPFAVDLENRKTPIDLTDLASVQLDNVAYLQIYYEEDILHHCDLMDMPGISDPNMSSEVWERMIGRADGVLWCSHATQAWRQSEAAVWQDMPDLLYDRSLLLLTRIDKLTTQADRARVLSRVKSETAGLFADVLPISLLIATREQDDPDRWKQSGAAEFAERLVALLRQIQSDLTQGMNPDTASHTVPRMPKFEQPEAPAMERPADARPAIRIIPRRVRRDAAPRPNQDLPQRDSR